MKRLTERDQCRPVEGRSFTYTSMSMAQTLSKTVVDSQLSQDCVELRVRSREEQILRELGILHLDSKATRARIYQDETDATILKQAGVRYLNTEEYEENTKKELVEKNSEEMKGIMKPLSRNDAEILRAAGVTWLDNMAVVNTHDDTISLKLGCETCTTAADTVGESTVNTVNTANMNTANTVDINTANTVYTSNTVNTTNTINSTYAERELLRRLRNGWASTGEECGECGMPVICQLKGTMYECVICGVVGEDENYNPEFEDDYYPDFDAAGEIENHNVTDGPGLFGVGTSISAMTPSHESYERYDTEGHRSYMEENVGPEVGHRHCDSVEKTFEENHSNEKAYGYGDDDDIYKEELGLRLFDGWELTELNCPGCNLPLISEGDGAPSICLRCG